MLRLIFGIIVLCCLIFSKAEAVTADAKKKYPYPLITEDYGILSENDLAAYTWGMELRPFTEKEDSGGYNYWQCFPRDSISITLEDQGFSTEDVGWKDTLSELIIEIRAKPGVMHHYELRALGMFHLYEKKLHAWHKLMKGEKYVCLAGSFSQVTPKTVNDKTLMVYSWIYDKIKTKKGCSAYWDDCNRTYKQYLEEREKFSQ